jgi:hypothetical protein
MMNGARESISPSSSGASIRDLENNPTVIDGTDVAVFVTVTRKTRQRLTSLLKRIRQLTKELARTQRNSAKVRDWVETVRRRAKHEQNRATLRRRVSTA